jgi:hypothetical protein
VKKNLIAIVVLVLVAAPLSVWAAAAAPQAKMEEFSDAEYGYSFQYPSGWRIKRLPEGDANKQIRVRLQGPNGSSFMVVMEKADQKITKEEFQAGTQAKELVERMMSDTIEQIYKTIFRNIKATHMTVGEREDLSNDSGIKFYVSTLHTVANGKSIIVAGIHAFPFSEDYTLSFLMTAFTEKTAKAEINELVFVFNSFHLTSEPSIREVHPGPAAKALETVRPKP